MALSTLKSGNAIASSYRVNYQEILREQRDLFYTLLKEPQILPSTLKRKLNVLIVIRNIIDYIILPRIGIIRGQDANSMGRDVATMSTQQLLAIRDLIAVQIVRRDELVDHITSNWPRSFDILMNFNDIALLDRVEKLRICGAIAIGLSSFFHPSPTFKAVAESFGADGIEKTIKFVRGEIQFDDSTHEGLESFAGIIIYDLFNPEQVHDFFQYSERFNQLWRRIDGLPKMIPFKCPQCSVALEEALALENAE